MLIFGTVWGKSENMSIDDLIKYLDLEIHLAGGLFFRARYS